MVKVRAADGTTPIAGATVYLKKQTATGFIQVGYNFTDAAGKFTFNRLVLGSTYKFVVYSAATDFNGAIASKQGQVASDLILLDKSRIMQLTQGTPATNGPAGRAWAGTNGAAQVWLDVTP